MLVTLKVICIVAKFIKQSVVQTFVFTKDENRMYIIL